MQYMQYSSKTIKTQLRMCFKLKQAPSIHLWVILEPGKLTSFPKSIVDKVKVCRSKSVFCSIMITHKRPFVSYHYWTKYTKRMLIKRTDPRTLSMFITWTELILAINSHTISLLSVAVERHFLVMYACAHIVLSNHCLLVMRLGHYISASNQLGWSSRNGLDWQEWRLRPGSSNYFHPNLQVCDYILRFLLHIVTEEDNQKSTETRLKNIENVGRACQKVCKQGWYKSGGEYTRHCKKM